MARTEQAPEETAEAAAVAETWEPVKTGLGREWKFENEAPLIGFLVGAESVPLPDDDERDHARAFIFAHVDTGEQLFLWESHELATALLNVNVGDKVRISFLGYESFTSKDGPKQVKRYKV